MTERLRYTGEWPPLDVLRKFPNWEYALDEEGFEEQDETTLRPEPEQRWITGNTAYTAGKATQADGTERDVIFELMEGQIDAVHVFVNPVDTWRVVKHRHAWNPYKVIWKPYVMAWLPEEENPPPLTDATVYPLRVKSVLSFEGTGEFLETTVGLKRDS